jgi:PKD repeat protein
MGCINQESNEPNHPPVANFTYYLEGATLHCIDLSSDNDNLVYVWDFGDDSFATEKNPSHTYSKCGHYTITLSVYDGIETREKSQDVVINVAQITNISLACWNLHVFGPSKASNQSLLMYYAEHLRNHDIFVIQEIRDKTGDAIRKLADRLPHHSYIISERAGRSISKEQYAIFYNEQVVLLDYYDWGDQKKNYFERPPLQATFRAKNWTFTLYTIHTTPDDVPGELGRLETLIGNPPGDTIIIGDLNTDGSYYDEDTPLHFLEWEWVITNDIDTTVAPSNNTYDRVILNDKAVNNYLTMGIMTEVIQSQSDHYLIYALFNPQVP